MASAGCRSAHGDDKTADRPEYAIFDAPDHPNPTLCNLVGGGTRNQQMDECDEGDILEVNAEKQSDAKDRLDRAGDIHPGRRRLEACLDEELKRCRHGDLADDVRNKEHRTDNAQDVELIEQIEFVGKRHVRCPPGGLTSHHRPKIALLDACANPSRRF